MNYDPSKYKEAYLKESRAHLKVMNASLLKLEKNPNDSSSLRGLSHAMHSLKSLAATLGYNDTMNLCHSIEDVIELIRHNQIQLSQCSDLLFHCFDHLNTNIKNIEEDKTEISSDELIHQLQSLNKLKHPKKILKKKIDDSITIEPLEKIKSLEVKVEHLDSLMNLTEELLACKMKFDSLRDQFDNPEITANIESLGHIITDLQYRVIQIRLMPIETIFSRFMRMVRDLGKQQNKEVDLIIEGGDIELDRLLLDQVSESIAHILRNAIDHGLESTETRVKLGKNKKSTIILRATRSKDSAIIEITDDGAGLNLAAIKELAVKQHLLSPNATDDEIKNAIFLNISTNKSVSEVSGRGLGLSIVKEKIELIGGNIYVNTIPGEKTSFFLKIPLTLAIIKMLVVKVAGEMYSVPIDSIERLITATNEDFKGLLNLKAVIFEDKDIPIINLSELFGNKSESQTKHPIVIVRKGDEFLGLVVDSLIATQEVVIKPLNRTLKENRYFAGVAMIGSGEIVLILDMNYLFNIKMHKIPSTA